MIVVIAAVAVGEIHGVVVEVTGTTTSEVDTERDLVEPGHALLRRDIATTETEALSVDPSETAISRKIAGLAVEAPVIDAVLHARLPQGPPLRGLLPVVEARNASVRRVVAHRPRPLDVLGEIAAHPAIGLCEVGLGHQEEPKLAIAAQDENGGHHAAYRPHHHHHHHHHTDGQRRSGVGILRLEAVRQTSGGDLAVELQVPHHRGVLNPVAGVLNAKCIAAV